MGNEGTPRKPNSRATPQIWTRGQKLKKYSAKDGAPKRLRCGTIQKEVS